jgi:hypothetical protein
MFCGNKWTFNPIDCTSWLLSKRLLLLHFLLLKLLLLLLLL